MQSGSLGSELQASGPCQNRGDHFIASLQAILQTYFIRLSAKRGSFEDWLHVLPETKRSESGPIFLPYTSRVDSLRMQRLPSSDF